MKTNELKPSHPCIKCGKQVSLTNGEHSRTHGAYIHWGCKEKAINDFDKPEYYFSIENLL